MAKLWGVSYATMWRMIEQKKCPWDLFLVTTERKVAKKSDVLKALEAVRIPAGT